MGDRMTSKEDLKTRCSCTCSSDCWKSWVKNNVLLVCTLAAVFLGIIVGLGLRAFDLPYEVTAWVGIWGQLFMRMLKCVMIPLLFTCLTVGISSMQGTGGGRVGIVTLTYIFGTQLLSAVFALALGLAIKPGERLEQEDFNRTYTSPSYTDLLGDILRNTFPDNLFRACLENGYTRVSESVIVTYVNETMNLTVREIEREYVYRSGPNIMGLVIISMSIGVGINVSGPAGKPTYNLLVSLQEVIFKIMMGIIWLSPIGIFSLMASSLMKVEDLSNVMSSVGRFIGGTLIVELIYMFVLLPLVLTPILQQNVYKIIYKYLNAILAGFAPPSSAAALPLLLQDSVEKLDVDPRIAGFVAPISVTINRDGSAIYVPMAVLFIAQTYGISLTAIECFMLVVMTVIMMTATGAAPSGSIVIIMTICDSLGIPSGGERIAFLMASEWILDRVRTAANCESHGMSIVVVDKFCRNHLDSEPDDVDSVGHQMMTEKLAISVDLESHPKAKATDTV